MYIFFCHNSKIRWTNSVSMEIHEIFERLSPFDYYRLTFLSAADSEFREGSDLMRTFSRSSLVSESSCCIRFISRRSFSFSAFCSSYNCAGIVLISNHLVKVKLHGQKLSEYKLLTLTHYTFCTIYLWNRDYLPMKWWSCVQWSFKWLLFIIIIPHYKTTCFIRPN